MANQNYKRTMAGSVGAGMGALFNGSGRTYYILEHKTSSKYHSAGESQKIIIDQVELGRAPSCQVRFDETFETVSRRHAAIVRDGQNWKLVHLSTSNPTLVNGQSIQGSYYLQSGDEIQLSVGGPRMGFIVPQGRQSLTSSIKLTERMNLFRQQALRPYRRAIWALSALLLLAVLGFGAWNYKLSQDNKALRQEIAAWQVQIDSLTSKKETLQTEEAQLAQQLAKNPNNQQVRTRYITVQRQLRTVVDNIGRAVVEQKKAVEQLESNGVSKEEIAKTGYNDSSDSNYDDDDGDDIDEPGGDDSGKDDVVETPAPTKSGSAATDIESYGKSIYTIKVKSISLEKDGVKRPSMMSTSNINCGTGFLLSNGTFVTARQNIQPWVYSGRLQGEWRKRMAQYVAAGCNVIIEYDAYSSSGSGKKLSFTNTDFLVDVTGDVISTKIDVAKDIWVDLENMGFVFSKRVVYDVRQATTKSRSYAMIPGKGGAGIPYDAGLSQSLPGNAEVVCVGYSGNPSHTNLHLDYRKSNTSRIDLTRGVIVLQGGFGDPGLLGAPVFAKENDGSFRVIGMNVGDGCVAPVSLFN